MDGQILGGGGAIGGGGGGGGGVVVGGGVVGGGGTEHEVGKPKDDEYESRSGSDNLEGGSGDELDGENPPKKKRYHRHTPQQIQELEA